MQNNYNGQICPTFLFKSTIFTLFLLFLGQQVSFAQCNQGTPDCASSEIIGFPFSTSMIEEINNGGDIPGCAMGAFHNTTWYRIIPSSTGTIGINVNATNCTTVGTNSGFQAGLYTSCNPNTPAIGDVQCTCTTNVTLSGPVVAGVEYFILIDGCGGSACDLQMSLTTSVDVQAPVTNLGTPDMPTASNTLPCPGAEVTFSVPDVEDADTYTWNLPSDVTNVVQDCNTITVNWGNTPWNVNVTANVNNGPSNSGPGIQIDIDNSLQQTYTGTYCTPGTGAYVFFGNGMSYTEGVYNVVSPGPVCDTPYVLTVIEYRIGVSLVIPEPTLCNSNGIGYVPNGQATIFMEDHGGAPYSFQWQNGSSTGPTNTELPVGSTNVTITDNNGCQIQQIVNIGEPDLLQAFLQINMAPSCANAADGDVEIDVFGGTGPFFFAWGDGSTMGARTDMPAGIFEVTVTDDNGCTFAILDQIQASGGGISATISNQSGESCVGANNGSVTLTGDGAGPFTFTWPDGTVAATRTDLAADDYEVTISNGSSCTGTQNITIASGSTFTVNPPDVTGVNCFGETNGTVTITVGGATAPVTYDLGSGTVTGNVISDLAAGNYTLTVTDGSNCTSGDIPIIISTPSEFLPTIANTPVSCGGGSDGTATVTPNGGTAPYTYLWGDSETTPSINSLSGGTYDVTVTDANMCSVELSTIVAGGGSLILTEDPASTNLIVSCVGASDGQVTIDVSGATGTIMYDWVGTTSNTGTATGLAAGSYTLNVEDGAGCTGSFPVTITDPDPLVVMEVGTTPASCAGEMDGSAEVSVAGGTGTNYTFEWDNGETVNPAIGLSAGPHTVIVRDENMCPQTQNVTIGEATPITAMVTPMNETCAGENDGTITVNAAGGSGSYLYNIGNGTQASNIFDNLPPDNYTVVVTNLDGSCAESFPVSVVGQTAITAMVTPTNVSCAGENDGQASVTPSGGLAPYTYLWTDGETMNAISGKSGGGYFVTVTDANMCTQVFPAAIGELTEIDIILDNQTAVSCDGSTGGTASVNVSGGAGNYSYSWSAGTPNNNEVSDLPAGDVTVVVTDGANCSSMPFVITISAPDPVTLLEDEVIAETCFNSEDGEVTVMTNGGNGPFEFDLNGDLSTQQNSNEFTGLAPGDYTVNVTDVNGCTGFVDIIIPAATQIVGSVNAVSELTICDEFTNGSVTIDASGGDGDLSFQLDNGAIQTSNVFDNLGGGNYTVTVIDENNCSIDVPVMVTELPEIILSVDSDNSELVVCTGAASGTVRINASGGDDTFMYSLGPDTQASNEFTGLGDGSYTVIVTDGNGCTNDIDFNVTELAPITIDIDNAASDLIVCTGASDGTATITASGGDNDFTYSIPGATNNNGMFDNLDPDTYMVTVMDGNMCSETFQFTVNPAPAITAQVDGLASELDICDGETNGSVTIDAGGGDGNFMYTLGAVTQPSPIFNNLSEDTYLLTVEDGNGCTETVNFTIAATAPIIASITASDLEVCDGFSDGSVTITASGGDDDFTYEIDGNEQTSNVFNNLAPGPHTVIITDGNGCTTTPIDFTVIEGDEINASIVDATSNLLICDGESNGSITIIASGGTGGLMYSIDNINFQNSNEFTGLGEGSYTIMIMDEDGCSPMAVPVNIAALAPVVGTIDPASELSICNGETIGSIVVDGSGGDGTIRYRLDNGPLQSSNIFADLPAGNYSIDIFDGNNCTSATIPVQIIEANPLTVTFDPNSDLINCFGEMDGSVTINANGGSGGFMYDIGPGPQASPTFDNLAPGSYFITVTDMNNCPATPIEITVVEAPVLDVMLTDGSSDLTVCSGVADAVATFEATGGDGNYSYSIDNNPAQPNNIFSDLAEGPHTVSVMDGNGCEIAFPFMVTAAPAIDYTSDITNVSCFGEAEGQIMINVIGGDGPFDFAWSDAQVTETAQQLAAGPQTVTITDANMCQVMETFIITQPTAALLIDNPAVVIQPATCGDTNGSVSISVDGGTAPYTYQWSDNMTTDPDLTAVGPGSYTVTVTDANLCTAVSTPYSVSEPGALEVIPTAIPVACNGEDSGEIILDVTGGTMPYTFAWSDDPMETTGIRNTLSEGNYTVTVSDADNCVLPELNITVTEPEPLMTTLTPTQASCGAADGSVSLLVSGGTGPGTYTYAWSNGSSDPNLSGVEADIYDVTITDQNMCQFISTTTEVSNPGTPELTISGEDVVCFGASTGSINLGITGGSGGNTITWNVDALNGLTNPTNLPAGDYIATVIDNSMCSASIAITIDEPAAAIEITEIQVSQATCGNSNGSVTVDVNGGTGNYTYTWSEGNGTNTVTGLSPGIVVLEIMDENMCTATASYNVSEPDALQVDIAQTTVVDASCNGTNTGSIDVTVIGGTGPGTYMYAWDNGLGSTEDLTNLPAGTYTLLITDGVGCEFTYETTIAEPTELTAISTPVMANCGQNNGAINITVSGGTEPYNYVWSDMITVSEDLNNAPAGNYSVTITDDNNCEFILTDDILNPNPPMIGIVATDVTCNNTATGIAMLNVTGGSGNYTYEWSDATFDGQNNPTNLPANTYTVTVSDNLNCSAVETFVINEPEELVLNIEEVVQATCGNANGSVSIEITGGIAPYDYTWSNGATDEDLDNLVPGTYVLDFMDGNGCTLNESFEVSEPNALTVVPGPISQVDCPGGNNGSIQVSVEGGSGPGTYTLVWDNGDTDETIDNLTAGTYTLVVTDTDGCSFTYSETINEPAPIMVTGTIDEAVCGESNGSISLAVTGGSGDYTYVWDNGAAPVANPDGLPAGIYNVTVTDQNNCIADPFTFAVTSPNAPQIEFLSADVSCNGAADGSIDFTVTGGTGMVTVTLNGQEITETFIDNLSPGIYEIIAEDEEGCLFPSPVMIIEPPLLEAFVVDPQSSTLCNGSTDGSIELTVQGGTGDDYDFQWTNGAGNVQNPDNLGAGVYDVIVTDGNGCTTTETATISEPDAIALTGDSSPASCSNTADGEIEISIDGGTGEYSLAWNNGLSDDLNQENLQPGNYTLVVTDQNGCNGTIDVIVEAPEPVDVNLADVSNYSGFNTSCNESEDGFITVSAEGGNGGYAYAWTDGTDGPTISEIGQGSYSVIVTDQEGCSGESNFSLNAPAPIIVDVETDEPECFGEDNGVVIINGVEGGRLPYRFSLNNGDYTTAQFFGNLTSGTYSLAVEDANGCTNDLNVIVNEVEQLTVSLSDEPVISINLGDSITLSPQTRIELDSNFVWSIPFDGDTLSGTAPVVRPFNTTAYAISVTDEFGCTATDEVLVEVTKPRSVYMPNAFNPNSVIGNNQWMISGGQDVQIVRSLDIYNRWGEIVYADRLFPTDNPLRGSWDGNFRSNEAPSGVYIYIIEVEFIDGQRETYSGDITLLR